MDPYIIARVVHVLSVVLWIGGVVMVTLVLLPAIKRLIEPKRRVEAVASYDIYMGNFYRDAIYTRATGAPSSY